MQRWIDTTSRYRGCMCNKDTNSMFLMIMLCRQHLQGHLEAVLDCFPTPLVSMVVDYERCVIVPTSSMCYLIDFRSTVILMCACPEEYVGCENVCIDRSMVSVLANGRGILIGCRHWRC